MKCDELKPLIFSIVDLAYVDEIRVTRNFQNPHDHAVYKATEVDAAIAELKQKLEDYRYTIAVLRKEKSHHKYKRCLAMAGRCRLRARWFGDNVFYKKEQWALKWHRKWLVLAEKFKEAK